METKIQQPRNVFEQILLGQLTVNNNVVALSKNVEILNERFDDIMSLFAAQIEVLPEDKKDRIKEESVLNN